MGTVLADIAADLASDGDEVELPDGRTVRLSIEADSDASVMGDGDWYGALAWSEESSWSRWRAPRPDGFDGNAEIIRPTQGHDELWWQPPADMARGTDAFDKLRATLCDVLDYGYVWASVEVFTHRDIYGRGCVENVASLGGIEAMYDAGYMAEVVGDLLAEVLG